jgi:hypothetical protein
MGLCDLLLRAAGYREAGSENHEIPAAFRDVPVARDSSWSGSWVGLVRTGPATVPLKVVFDTSGMSAALGTGALHHTDAAVSNGILEASLTGELPRANVGGLPHSLDIKLRRSGDSLTGYLSATVKLSDRPFLMLPFYVSMERAR